MTVLLCAAILVGILQSTQDETRDVQSAIGLYQRASRCIAEQDTAAALVPLRSLVDGYADDPLAEISVVHLAECLLIENQSQDAFALIERWGDRLANSRTLPVLAPTTLERMKQLRFRAAQQSASAAESEGAWKSAIRWWQDAARVGDRQQRLLADSQSVRACVRGCMETSCPCDSDSLIALIAPSRRYLVHSALAELHRKSGSFDLAIEQISQAIHVFPKFASGKHRAANQTTLDAERRSAKPTPLASKDSWNASLELRYCELLVLNKEYAPARRRIEAARSRYPDYELAHEFNFLLARCAISNVDFQSARRHLSELLHESSTVDPHVRARAHWMLGEIHFLSKQYQPALDAYAEAILMPTPEWQARALLQTARCEELLGRREAAVASYQKLQREFSDTAFARSAADRLSQLAPKTIR